tara:strand:- start:209094 stop:209900 length:807 start_codon:yes stop_codon:yes gene_type:complete
MILQQVKGFLKTPSLWEDTLFGVNQFAFPKIALDTFTPKPIPQNIRLGHQIEYIFYQLIEHSQAYDILLFNQPIKADKRTIGEIDFILKNRDNQELIHVELTYKFYLIDPTFSEPIQQLIGPNRKDSFYDKLQKIKNKQFKLLQTQEAINTLKKSSINTGNIISNTCFKAQLFFPYIHKELNTAPFERSCVMGYWLTLKEFDTALFYQNKFYLPTKHEWVITPHRNEIWKSHTEITAEIAEHHANQNTPMIWMIKSNSTIEKFFVVWW